MIFSAAFIKSLAELPGLMDSILRIFRAHDNAEIQLTAIKILRHFSGVESMRNPLMECAGFYSAMGDYFSNVVKSEEHISSSALITAHCLRLVENLALNSGRDRASSLSIW